jgi:tetratricopeptide (TPR) repeat protein
MFFTAGLVFLLAAPNAGLQNIHVLIQQGKIVEAITALESLEHTAASDPDTLLEIGRILQQLADSRARQLEQLAPDSPEAHELRGRSLEAHGNLSDALTEYRLAAKTNPDAPGYHFLVGNVLWKQRDLAAALPELERELKINPDHDLANLRAGEILLVLDPDRTSEAIALLAKAASQPDSPLEAHRELGKALHKAGRDREALQKLQLVAARRPADDSVHALLAAVYRSIGQSSKAAQELQLQRRILAGKLAASQQTMNPQTRH